MTGGSRAAELKLLARHSLVYGAGRVLDRALGFLMLPVYTRFLSPADYGVLELVYVTLGYLGLIIEVGVSDSISRFYFASDERSARHRVVSTAYLCVGLVALLGTTIMLLLSPWAAERLFDDRAYTTLLKLAFGTLFFGVFTDIGFTWLRIRKQSVALTLTSSTKLLISLALNIVFVVVLEFGVLGILLSGLISNALFALLLTVPILRTTGLGFSKTTARDLLVFGLPLVPSNLASTIVRNSDRYFVKEIVGLAEAGLYGLGYKFGLLVHQFITTPFIQIWTPRRLELMAEDGRDRTFATLFAYFMFVVCFVGLGVSVLGHDVVRLMAAPGFERASVVIPWIVLGHVVLSLYYHFYIPILIAKRTTLFIYANFVTAGVALVLNFTLIRRYGMLGAAWSTVASYTVRVVLVYLFATRLGRLSFDLRRFTLLLVTGVGLYVASTYVVAERMLIQIGGRSLVWLVYPVLLAPLGFFDREESAQIMRLLDRLGFDSGSLLHRAVRLLVRGGRGR